MPHQRVTKTERKPRKERERRTLIYVNKKVQFR